MCDTHGGPDPGFTRVRVHEWSTPEGRVVKDWLAESITTKKLVSDQCVPDIIAAANLMIETFKAGGKVLMCGNGGSAADCQHMAAELVPHGLAAIALTTDTSFITAWSNDHDFAGIFVEQLVSIGRSGDTLIAISTSGKSPNVLQAVGYASTVEIGMIVLTGQEGDALSQFANVSVRVPSTNTQHIQEAHLAIEHILCELVIKAMEDDN